MKTHLSQTYILYQYTPCALAILVEYLTICIIALFQCKIMVVQLVFPHFPLPSLFILTWIQIDFPFIRNVSGQLYSILFSVLFRICIADYSERYGLYILIDCRTWMEYVLLLEQPIEHVPDIKKKPHISIQLHYLIFSVYTNSTAFTDCINKLHFC